MAAMGDGRPQLDFGAVDTLYVSTLRRSIGNIDDSLWDRLPGLAPGQAVVSFGHMQHPVLVAIDPAPAQLRMVD